MSININLLSPIEHDEDRRWMEKLCGTKLAWMSSEGKKRTMVMAARETSALSDGWIDGTEFNFARLAFRNWDRAYFTGKQNKTRWLWRRRHAKHEQYLNIIVQALFTIFVLPTKPLYTLLAFLMCFLSLNLPHIVGPFRGFVSGRPGTKKVFWNRWSRAAFTFIFRV